MARRPLMILVVLTIGITLELSEETTAQDTAKPAAPAAKSQAKSSTGSRPKIQDSRKSERHQNPTKNIKPSRRPSAAGASGMLKLNLSGSRGSTGLCRVTLAVLFPTPATRWFMKGSPGTPRLSWSISIPRSSAMKTCSIFSGKFMTRLRLTGRAKTKGRSIAR